MFARHVVWFPRNGCWAPYSLIPLAVFARHVVWFPSTGFERHVLWFASALFTVSAVTRHILLLLQCCSWRCCNNKMLQLLYNVAVFRVSQYPCTFRAFVHPNLPPLHGGHYFAIKKSVTRAISLMMYFSCKNYWDKLNDTQRRMNDSAFGHGLHGNHRFNNIIIALFYQTTINRVRYHASVVSGIILHPMLHAFLIAVPVIGPL